MFARGPLLGFRILLVGVLSLAIGVADLKLDWLDSLKESMSVLLVPVQWSVQLPGRIGDFGESITESRSSLLEKNASLENRLRILQVKALKTASLTAEVNRLRALLNASAFVDESVLVAEIIGINPDPYMHEVMINKGSNDGVFEGQPLLDSMGLMGQVTAVTPYSARVLLIADSAHAIPIEVNRNGSRGILVGTGVLDRLELVNIPDTTDIKVGDMLVSSGLGGRFPKGYPVARVESVTHDPGLPFAQIYARPLAELNRSKHVLLVFKRPGEDRALPNIVEQQTEPAS
ncbi:rod shape-determining protein MreC [Allohahella marinimesophila]|uniref:rod shape-determining protein MreC n=1 Tax=Allohahella marinimesophila TaxID=1054972 RepID=UPI0031DFE675